MNRSFGKDIEPRHVRIIMVHENNQVALETEFGDEEISVVEKFLDSPLKIICSLYSKIHSLVACQ